MSNYPYSEALLRAIDNIPSGVGRRLWRVLTIIAWFVLTVVFAAQVELNAFSDLAVLFIIAGLITGASSAAISYVITNRLW